MENLKSQYREVFDSHDPWGSNISAWFAVANEISWRGDETPAPWEYRPGAFADPREHDDSLFLACKQATTDDLTDFGNILERYDSRLRHADMNY